MDYEFWDRPGACSSRPASWLGIGVEFVQRWTGYRSFEFAGMKREGITDMDMATINLPGFAHGFGVFSESAEFLDKTTDDRAPEYERCIRWDDPQLAIDWRLQGSPGSSANDAQGKSYVEAEVFP